VVGAAVKEEFMRISVDRVRASNWASTSRAPRRESAAQDAAMRGARPSADLLTLQRLIDDRAASEPAALHGAEVLQAAQLGTSGASQPLPFLDTIQTSFGRHDVSGIAAHTDQAATSAARAIDATAFATGNHVAFAQQPSLHTAAHEAAHVIQQRGSVQLEGGVGAAGDRYERHADAVADQVVQGNSAEGLLDEHVGAGAGPSVQRESPTSAPQGPSPTASQPAPSQPASAPKTEDKPTSADGVEVQWTFKDVLVYPLLADMFKDLVCKQITPADRKLLALNGTEAAAFYAWAAAAGLAPFGLGGTKPKDVGEYFGAVYDYADVLTGLTPGKSAIFDPLSRIVGLRVDDYLASDLFITRAKTHAASVVALLTLLFGSYSLYSFNRSKNTDPTLLDSDDWDHQLALLKKLGGAIFKEHLKAPTFFDMGPLQLATHPIFAYAPFAGGAAPSGVFFDRKEDVTGKLREQKYGATFNLPKFFKPDGVTTEDVGDPAKYRGWQGSAWFNYEAKDPLTLGPFSQPFSRFKGGTIFGYGGHLAELEAGAQYSGNDARALTSWFVRGGYGYAAGEKDQDGIEKYGLANGKRIGFTATFFDWKETDVLAPRDAAGAPLAGFALKTTPFLALRINTSDKVTVDASAAVSFVTGQTGGKATAGVSDAAATLSITYLGDSAPGKLPRAKIDLTGSVGRFDWWAENSPLLWGLQVKGNVGAWFAGAQVNTGAGGISPERKDAFDPKVKTMVPTAVMFTGGYSF